MRRSIRSTLLLVLGGAMLGGSLCFGYVFTLRLRQLPLSSSQLETAATELWWLIGISLCLGSLFLWFASVWFDRSVVQPIERVRNAAEQMAMGDLNQRVIVSSSHELRRLVETFNRLAYSGAERVQELTAAKEQLETVISNTVSGILLLDRKGTVLLCNPAAKRILGFMDEELPCDHRQLIHNPAMNEQLEQALGQAEPFRQEIKLTSPLERVVELNVVPLPAQNRYVAVFYDVSEARRLASIRADLVANVSHELKTPVTSIHGFAETLLQGALEDERARRRFVEIIYRESGRLSRLVNDLMDLSRLELDPRAVEKRSIDLVKTVLDAVERSSLKAEEKQITLRTVIGVEQAEMQGDEHRLGQAVGNLIDNAIKYTPAGGEVRVNLEFDKQSFCIAVRDNGIGIEPEHLARIFERFYRADKARSRQLGGTGLGLAIVKHIVELHGGQAWAESKVGEGSVFYLRLPIDGAGEVE